MAWLIGFILSSLQKMQLVIEPDVGTDRQAADDPHQLIDDAFSDLLIDLLRDAVNGLIRRSAGDFLDLVMRQQYGLPALLFCHVVLLSASLASISYGFM